MPQKETSPEWEQGYDAYHAGASETANPYDVHADSIRHMDWNDGWNAAQDENED